MNSSQNIQLNSFNHGHFQNIVPHETLLVSANETSNFIYHIDGFQGGEAEMEHINAIQSRNKIKDRITAIKALGGMLRFSSLENDVFKNNLVLIDSLLPHILAALSA